ncbi:hypothetical protein FRB90_005258, partial [Tulasnella sp. 427]
MRRGRRDLDDDDDNDNEGDEDALPMRYATAGAGSMSSSSYQYGVVGSLPHPPSPRRRTDTLQSLSMSSSFEAE